MLCGVGVACRWLQREAEEVTEAQANNARKCINDIITDKQDRRGQGRTNFVNLATVRKRNLELFWFSSLKSVGCSSLKEGIFMAYQTVLPG